MKSVIRTLLLMASSAVFSAAVASQSAIELQQATTINSLSGELLAARLQHDGLGNSMVSAVSLYYALSLLREGAGGEAANTLDKRLLRESASAVSEIAPELASILTTAEASHGAGTGEFQLANSIWSTNGASDGKPFVFAEPYAERVASLYDASAHAIDFSGGGGSLFVNRWAEEKTYGLIPEIIDDGTLRVFKWLLINAAYFEGGWSMPMRAIPGRDERWFTTLDGNKVAADSIRTRDYKGKVLDLEGGHVAFRLPFRGQKYSFIVYMPGDEVSDYNRWLIDEGATNMSTLVPQVYANESQIYQLSVRLPKFAFNDQVVMNEASAITLDLGLVSLFSNGANYSALVDYEKTHPFNARTTVGLIKQDTRIELDENGVKAAAVTMVGGIKVTAIGPPIPPRVVNVDRPFAFAIVENNSQTILFNGILTEPM